LAEAFVAENDRERARMRRLVERLAAAQLAQPVNDSWTIAGVLGHIAFWDTRAIVLGRKFERGAPFSPDETEPEDVDWINDASRPLIHAIEPVAARDLALRIADETDALMASLATRIADGLPSDAPLNPLRATHRREHLDDIEAALRAGDNA
jgi:DinB superfamily